MKTEDRAIYFCFISIQVLHVVKRHTVVTSSVLCLVSFKSKKVFIVLHCHCYLRVFCEYDPSSSLCWAVCRSFSVSSCMRIESRRWHDICWCVHTDPRQHTGNLEVMLWYPLCRSNPHVHMLATLAVHFHDYSFAINTHTRARAHARTHTHTHTHLWPLTPIAGGNDGNATAEAIATCAGIAPFNSLQGWRIDRHNSAWSTPYSYTHTRASTWLTTNSDSLWLLCRLSIMQVFHRTPRPSFPNISHMYCRYAE